MENRSSRLSWIDGLFGVPVINLPSIYLCIIYTVWYTVCDTIILDYM